VTTPPPMPLQPAMAALMAAVLAPAATGQVRSGKVGNLTAAGLLNMGAGEGGFAPASAAEASPDPPASGWTAPASGPPRPDPPVPPPVPLGPPGPPVPPPVPLVPPGPPAPLPPPAAASAGPPGGREASRPPPAPPLPPAAPPAGGGEAPLPQPIKRQASANARRSMGPGKSDEFLHSSH
jgi:hypothetical protein